jgi:hypothetical protein
VWNFVPECGALNIDDHTKVSSDAPVDGLIHMAMKTASSETAIPTTKHPYNFGVAFCERLTYAKCWLQFCPRTYRVLKNKKDRVKLRARAIERIDRILGSARIHMQSSIFIEMLDRHRTANVINLFQLFFVELGRYKRCELFTGPMLLEELKQLPE